MGDTSKNLEGKAEHLGGKIQEKLGEVLGDRELERKGQLNQLEGQAKQDAAQAEEAWEEAERRRRMAEESKDRL